jgi:hypothetical protein
VTQPGNIKHSLVIGLRLAPEVYQLVESAANAQGKKPAEWLRSAVLTNLSLQGIAWSPETREQLTLGEAS